MALLLPLLVLAWVAGCGAGAGGDEPEPAPVTELRVTAWPNGEGSEPVHRWTLRCDPAGGSFPSPARTCAQLAEHDDPFAPVPAGVACTEIYGGPAVAVVEGTYRGERVETRFSRTNGCEIARWNRFLPVFPHVEPPPG